jgi:hypothetical protein
MCEVVGEIRLAIQKIYGGFGILHIVVTVMTGIDQIVVEHDHKQVDDQYDPISRFLTIHAPKV